MKKVSLIWFSLEQQFSDSKFVSVSELRVDV